MILLIQLFLAHILGDFFLQPDEWIKNKKEEKLKSPYLYLHTLIHFGLVLLVTDDLGFWGPALLIAILHFVIDGLKLLTQKDKTERRWFFVDQLLHAVVILSVWSYKQNIGFDLHALSDKNILIPATAILFVLNPASYIIKTVISKWTPAFLIREGDNGSADESLINAGKLIGMIERSMILVFVFLGKWEGIGFLLAAKSVFRFGELKNTKDMKLTEYILIGTFLSFGLAIATGLIAVNLLGK